MSTKSKAKKSQTVKPSPVSPEVPEHPAAAMVLPKVQINEAAAPINIVGGVEIDMKVTAADVADLMVNGIEDALIGKKQDINVVLRSLRNDLAEVQKTLKDESTKQAEAYSNKNATALAKAMHNFTGQQYTVKVKADGLDVEEQEVTAKVTVLAKVDLEKKEKYQRSHPSVEQDFKMPANATIVAAIKKLTDLTEKIRAQEKEVEGVNRHLADLPRYIRKAKAQMTRMALSGTPLTGPALLASLEEMQTLALPAPK